MQRNKNETKVTAAKDSLQRKMEVRDKIVKNKEQAQKNAHDEYRLKQKMIEEEFTKQTAVAEAGIQQERKKLEDAQKEFEADQQQKIKAFANVSAATYAGIASGVSLISVADGNIVHSNSIDPAEMLRRMMTEHPGIPEVTVASIVKSNLEFMQQCP